MGWIAPPPSVVRHDGDDPYLVVAADKGTATFSDIANAIALEYGFWLGDAFASGGSQGYDHKGMGITARGAWESVKRHFRELGLDTQQSDFTVVGIGDMGGDVFGNGMLLSRHVRLVGAFNHMHIFIDPDPDPESTFLERQRLFAVCHGRVGTTSIVRYCPRAEASTREAPSRLRSSSEARAALAVERRVADARRADRGDAQGTRGSPVERRYRHLREIAGRIARRSRRSGQRRRASKWRRAPMPRRRRREAISASLSSDASSLQCRAGA